MELDNENYIQHRSEELTLKRQLLLIFISIFCRLVTSNAIISSKLLCTEYWNLQIQQTFDAEQNKHFASQ
jgi:hypothetical protein